MAKLNYDISIVQGSSQTVSVPVSTNAGPDVAIISGGAQGIPGKSAYQIAVDHGFVGTEEQWLASLQGSSASPEEVLQAHIDHPTPHPAYDDIPSLTLLFENGLI